MSGAGAAILERDEQIREMLAAGLTDADIAPRLDVSAYTVAARRKALGLPANAEPTHPRAPVIHDLERLTPEEESQALCAQTDPEAFFPEKGGTTRAAKKVCAECPLTRVEDGGNGRCLEIALANDERFGVWGGLSERERRLVAAGKPLPKAKPRGPVPEHGTVAGWRRHTKLAEEPCQECTAANDEWRAKARANGANGRRGIRPVRREHGTPKGYRQHQYRGDPACDECKDAHNEYRRTYRGQRRAVAA